MNLQHSSTLSRHQDTLMQKLEEELELLKSAMSKIDPASKDPSDIWALPVYRKIISRREKLAQLFGAA